MNVWEALKLARRKWSWYSRFEGSAATASVNSWAAFSHCWAFSYCMPCLKFRSPFFANAVAGKSNKQKVTRSETRMRGSVFFLILSLSSGGGGGPTWANNAVQKARMQLFPARFLHAGQQLQFLKRTPKAQPAFLRRRPKAAL